ncbi:Nuf2 subfamily protein [Pelomyxa schiedti]|nr:Nuf2 subfamily protein [Pelomyxa schiedti]
MATQHTTSTSSSVSVVEGPVMGVGTYTFQVLSVSDITNVLKRLRMPYSEHDIGAPTGEIVRGVCECVLKQILGIDMEELREPDWNVLKATGLPPDLLRDSVAEITFQNHVMDLCQKCGYNDFDPTVDFTTPHPQKMRQMFSAFINCMKYMDEPRAKFTDSLYAIETAELQMEALRTELDSAEKERASLLKKIEQFKSQVEEQQKKLCNLETEVLAQHIKQQALTDELENKKSEQETLTEKLSRIEFELKSTKQGSDILRSQLVEPPEQLEKTVKELEENIEKENKATQESERQFNELKSLSVVLDNYEKKLVKCSTALNLVADDMEKLAQVKNEANKAKASSESAASSLVEIDSEIEHANATCTSLSEKVAKLEELHNQQLANFEKMDADLKAFQEVVSKEESMLIAETEQFRTATSEVNKQHEAILEQMIHNSSATAALCARLQEAVQTYTTALLSSLSS